MYLGIDLGTSELKLVLLDRQHRLVASVGERLTVQRPAPLHSEQSPADWWDAMTRAMARLQAGIAVGVDGGDPAVLVVHRAQQHGGHGIHDMPLGDAVQRDAHTRTRKGQIRS